MTSTLAAALADQKKRKPGTRCSFEALYAELNDIDAQALRNALESTMPATNIARALTSEGHDINGQTVARHRRGDCDCEIL